MRSSSATRARVKLDVGNVYPKSTTMPKTIAIMNGCRKKKQDLAEHRHGKKFIMFVYCQFATPRLARSSEFSRTMHCFSTVLYVNNKVF